MSQEETFIPPRHRVELDDWEQKTLATVYIGKDRLEIHQKSQIVLMKDSESYIVEINDPDGRRFMAIDEFEDAAYEFEFSVEKVADASVEAFDGVNSRNGIITVGKVNDDRLRLDF
jgi:hypothetical protein